MKSVLIILTLLGLVVATPFDEWMVHHNKQYSNLGEYKYRLEVFNNNSKLVAQHNAEGHSWTLGLNQFADLTNQEYRELYLMPSMIYPESLSAGKVGSVTAIDWRTKGAVTPIKDQGQCGSCYAFSAVGSMEGCLELATGSLISLSEQELVDCSMSYGNLGCNGGLADNCFKYVIDKGDTTESNYPYKGVRGSCTTGKPVAISIKSYTDVASTETALQSAILGRPVSVAIDASLPSFQLYKSGSYCPTGCSSTNLDHAVLAVGMTNSYSTAGDYIVKNSWGTSWGLDGYIYMCANKNNNCGIATDASYPTGCGEGTKSLM
jgi:cathepsin L